jgi:adenylate kinase
MEGSLEARPGVLLVGAPGVGKRTILSSEISLSSFLYISISRFKCETSTGVSRLAEMFRIRIRCVRVVREEEKEILWPSDDLSFEWTK